MDEDEVAQELLTAFQRAADDIANLIDAAETLQANIERGVSQLGGMGGDPVDTPAIDGATQDLATQAHRLVFRGGQINQLQNIALELE